MKNMQGITLIALVVTIVVLLILAGISISMLTGENGIITQAQNAKEETRAGGVQDKRDLWISEVKAANITNDTAKSLESILNELLEEKLLTEEEVEKIMDPSNENREIQIGSKNISFKIEENNETLEEILKPGDFVQYDAGKWTQEEIDKLTEEGYYLTSNLPNSSNPYTFGGFGVNSDRNTSIDAYENSKITDNPEFQKGWKVLSNTDGVIKIISAGTLEAYQHSQNSKVEGFPSGGISEYILRKNVMNDDEHTLEDYANTGIIPRDFTMYENELAVPESAHCCDIYEMYYITDSLEDTTDPLRNLGIFYHLASCQEKVGLARVEPDGAIYMSTNTCYGIRIVITLKSNVKIAGDNVGDGSSYDKAWKLEIDN